VKLEFIAIVMLFVGGIHLVGSEFSSRFESAILGVPSGKTIGEDRAVFLPTEQMSIELWWKSASKNTPVELRWMNPSHKVVYTKQMTLKNIWRRLHIYYRGTMPLQSGKWSIEIFQEGNRVAAIPFEVVRKKSDSPIMTSLDAFKADKITLEDATNLLQSIYKKKQSLIDHSKKVSIAFEEFGHDGKKLSSSLYKDMTFAQIISTHKPHEKNLVASEMTLIYQSDIISPIAELVKRRYEQQYGFSLVGAKNSTVLLPANAYKNDLKDGISLLRQLCSDIDASEDCWKQSGFKLYSFKSQTFVYNAIENIFYESQYGRKLLHKPTLESYEIKNMIDKATAWFISNQLSSGRYFYGYLPALEKDDPNIWVLRELNALFVLSEIAIKQKDIKLLQSVEKALKTYKSAIIKQDGKTYLKWQQGRSEHSIAASAFVLATLVVLDCKDELPLMQKLAHSIMSMQNDDGSFKTDYIKSGNSVDQLYYPGEAMLALMYYYEYTKDKRVINVMQKSYDFYSVFWKSNKVAPYIPWQLRAFAKLYAVDRKQKYLDYIFEMQDWMLDSYPIVAEDSPEGLQGAMATMFASTGVYTEGLVAAYILAKQIKDKQRSRRYLNAIEKIMVYLNNLQFDNSDTYRFAEPKKIAGSMAFRPYYNEIRLDFTYHAISAVYMYYSTLLSEK
jgi:prenyltransferase beta subunit